ncbi:hypothetical protein [uncultured Draconibacterium sp.]|uniref:hypothetical protein n=1 Tax=uncultured Draconibacterium sp. TaxID=1573823 RepID=UPI0025D1B755|nr:hypothetical protein [uncultured Draconibacterium sp.]
MKKIFILFLFLVFMQHIALAQEDWSWWNDTHGWEVGDPGWRNWLIISPGYLGPNALPVPAVKRGILEGKTELEVTASVHFHSGDPTQDISGRAYVPFAKNRIAIEMYGVLLEHYAYTTEIRDERYSRDRDGKGYAVGDFYFTTLVQLVKDRKFPNTLFRALLKTASGSNLKGARYADTPAYSFDFSFSKDMGEKETILLRPHLMLGFYSWQTNDELNLQNDALLYGLGTDIEKQNWRFTSTWSGYYGYKNNGDRPMQLNFELRKDYDNKAFAVNYQHGLHDWLYNTLRFSFIWKLNGVE